MNHKQVLRYQPWLRYVNKHHISDRLLNLTNGDIFVAFNTRTGYFELHSVNSFRLSAGSSNAPLEPEFVNGFIITDFKANNHKKFGMEIESQRQKKDYLFKKAEEKRSSLDNMLKTIERTIGTKI